MLRVVDKIMYIQVVIIWTMLRGIVITAEVKHILLARKAQMDSGFTI